MSHLSTDTERFVPATVQPDSMSTDERENSLLEFTDKTYKLRHRKNRKVLEGDHRPRKTEEGLEAHHLPEGTVVTCKQFLTKHLIICRFLTISWEGLIER